MPSLPPTAPGFSFPDLTARPPRSPRVRLGGFVILPRLIDKARATLAGKQGDYIYNSGLDKRFFAFVEIDADHFLSQVATGAGDGALLAWITANAENKPADHEIAHWSAFQGERTATTVKAREHYHREHVKLAAERADIATGFDFLDLDDHVSFGGKA
jgi:hypothetical protein